MSASARRLRSRVASLLLLAFAAPAAAGELRFDPYVAGQYQYDSNVYRFSQQVREVTGTPVTDDRIVRLRGGADLGYRWSRQTLQAMGEYRRLRFDEFTALDHDEHLLETAFEGWVFDLVRLQAGARSEERMASFEDRRSTQLTIENEQLGHADLTLAVTPAWSVLAGVRGRRLRSPLPSAPALPLPAPGVAARNASPGFAVHERAAHLGLQHGIENKEHPELEAPLRIAGLLEYSTVGYSGVTEQPPTPPGVARDNFDGYALLVLGVSLNYSVSELSNFDAKLAASRYNPSNTAVTSRPDMTGEIGYLRKVTALTEVNARLFRRIVPYVATADSTTDTGVSVGARWEPVRDLTVMGDYSVASSAFGGLSRVAPENLGRNDTLQNATLSVAYPKLDHALFLRVFGAYTDRSSNRSYDDFRDVAFGAELSFRWSPMKNAPE